MQISKFLNVFGLVFIMVSCNNQPIRQSEIRARLPIDQRNCSISYKAELAKVGKFFTVVESDPLLLRKSTVPQKLKTFRGEVLAMSKLVYLRKLGSGYLINCELEYGYHQVLLCCTLDKGYCLKDYRFFIDGTKDFKHSDTISSVRFMNDGFIVEQMYLNQEEEPDYENDGIRKFEFGVNEQMQIQELE
jgi:hypothetical protein